LKKNDADKVLSAVAAAFQIPPPGLMMTSSFRLLVGWDSLAAVMLVTEIYAEYRAHISGKELRACETVADVFALVQTKVQASV